MRYIKQNLRIYKNTVYIVCGKHSAGIGTPRTNTISFTRYVADNKETCCICSEKGVNNFTSQ